ncbi:PCMD domain-containing protein [Butyricimonas synergistica]|uniref:PCMD domain-containing protein n=1 Tax=Butyricimonas synergistica TaxID=544644 RepID=UPI000372A122|nr:PCMD domain-containing protein [Butyricimonas synergistica]
MKNRFLLLLVLSIAFFTGCKDDDDPVPPTIDKVIGLYSGEKLKAMINGVAATENASVEIVRKEDNTIAFKLVNIVSGFPEFEIPNITHEALSRSYYSQLTGSVTDNISGYEVTAKATVEDKIMNINVTLSELAAEPTNAKIFYNTSFNGEMSISVGADPLVMSQRVYVTKPSTEDTTSFCLRIENFSFEGIKLGNIELDTIFLLKRGNIYAFTAKDRDLSSLEVPGITKVTLSARGAIIDNHTLQLDLTINAAPLTVKVTFKGEISIYYPMTSWTEITKATPYQNPTNLASSNPAAMWLPLSAGFIGHPELTAEPYPVSPDGDAAKILTRDTYGGYVSLMKVVVPKITAGTLFNGSFALNAQQPLKSTRFGEPYQLPIAPVAFKFTYKYIPGPTYYNTVVTGEGKETIVSGEEVTDKTDECSLTAYVYEVDSYDETLDGSNINTSEKVILKATFSSGVQDNFVEKTVNFEPIGNSSFEPIIKKYKLAIVCTPSKEGDVYSGAPESTLWVKSLEVTY